MLLLRRRERPAKGGPVTTGSISSSPYTRNPPLPAVAQFGDMTSVYDKPFSLIVLFSVGEVFRWA